MAKYIQFRRKKKKKYSYVCNLGASLLSLSSLGVVKRKRLKRLMGAVQSYISNNLFRKRQSPYTHN